MGHRVAHRLLAVLAGLALVAGPVGPARAASASWATPPPNPVTYSTTATGSTATATFTVRIRGDGVLNEGTVNVNFGSSPYGGLRLTTDVTKTIPITARRVKATKVTGLCGNEWTVSNGNGVTWTPVNGPNNFLRKSLTTGSYCSVEVVLSVIVPTGAVPGQYMTQQPTYIQWYP